MHRLVPPILAACALAVTTAFAQANPSGNSGQEGFFSSPRQSDPSLFRTLPSEAYQPAAVEPAGSQPPSPGAASNPADSNPANPNAANASRPLVVVVPEGGNGVQEQFDRSQIEAQQAQANRTPAPINGAFTGNTDPNNR